MAAVMETTSPESVLPVMVMARLWLSRVIESGASSTVTSATSSRGMLP